MLKTQRIRILYERTASGEVMALIPSMPHLVVTAKTREQAHILARELVIKTLLDRVEDGKADLVLPLFDDH